METNFYKSRCTLRDTNINASTDASGRASIESAFILLDVFFEQSVHSTLLDYKESTRLGNYLVYLLTRIVHRVAQELGKEHCEMILNNKTPRMLLLEHSQPTFRLIEGSEHPAAVG